ncbi:50S ribosomal protein L11 methyltransferase [Francisellaceae bacterium CB299]|jgi:ribosomal protein L11 methyltransferase
MQQWHQLEFCINSSNYQIVEEYLFDNLAASITQISKDDDIFLVTVLYQNDCDIDYITNDLKQQFSEILESDIKYELIKDQQWEAAWLYDYEPVEIGENIVVYPDWKEPPEDTSKTYILVDPSIAFGCGNHETTKMCLSWLEEHISKDITVLDYGCGTGVLAIGAVKLGAKYAEGIDIDPNSIESSIKNAQTNAVADNTHFSDTVSDKKFDLLVANIFSNVLISLVDVMLEKVKVGGKIALSGIIENQVEEVQNVFKERGIVFSEPKQMGQWFLLDGVKV